MSVENTAFCLKVQRVTDVGSCITITSTANKSSVLISYDTTCDIFVMVRFLDA